MEGVELEIRPSALTAIARKALARKTGARGLRSILEQSLLDTMFDLPTLENVAKVVVDEHTIEDDGKPLLVYSRAGQDCQRLIAALSGARRAAGRRCAACILQLPPRAPRRPEKERFPMSGHPDPARRADHAAAAAAARRGGVPAHGHPAVRRAARSRSRRSRRRWRPARQIMLVAQKAAGKDEPERRGHVRDRLRLQHPADAEAARRHGEGAGRGQRSAPRIARASPTTASTSSPRSTPVPPEAEADARGRGAAPRA